MLQLTSPKFQAFDNNGNFLVGGKLYTYYSLTDNEATTYNNSSMAIGTENTNPIVLDARGEAIIYGSIRYKFVLKDSSDSTIWTLDPVSPFSEVSENYIYTKAVGGITDESAIIQDEIDNANGIPILFKPNTTYRCNIVLKSNTVLTSSVVNTYSAVEKSSAPILKAYTSGWVIDTPATTIYNPSISNLRIEGLATDEVVGGIRFKNVTRGNLSCVNVVNCSEQGILLQTSLGTYIDRTSIIYCVQDTSRSAKIGALQLDADALDCEIQNCEVGAQLIYYTNSKTSANLYCCAVLYRGYNCLFSSVIGELSDVGFYIDGRTGRFINCRGEFNMGHGWMFTGNAEYNQITNCRSSFNSRDFETTGLQEYNGYNMNNAVGNKFSNCISESKVADYGYTHNYGFFDDMGGLNEYSNCDSIGDGTKFYGPIKPGEAGTTANRPTLSASNVGYQFWDTTIGKLIVWNGSAWKLADGSAP